MGCLPCSLVVRFVRDSVAVAVRHFGQARNAGKQGQQTGQGGRAHYNTPVNRAQNGGAADCGNSGLCNGFDRAHGSGFRKSCKVVLFHGLFLLISGGTRR